MLSNLIKELQNASNPEQAEILQKFFKTGEGDVFLGIKIPVQRKIAKKYSGLNLYKLQELLNSKIHDYRSVALFILADKYKKSNEENKGNVFNFYLKNTQNINNWDLVDLSAPKIVGDFLFEKRKNILYELAQSENLWEKRIAIISTFTFIKKEKFEDALAISELLLNDTHDLIHKAVGWMLREIGKRDLEVEENFLRQHYKNMPRTMLRYAIERFEEEKRKKYLRGEI
ncbi:DNA alkylation repair protein [Candidatus Pacearchaeota archaeon]|nr:DNA alkylation repair protein [Candidatus Pacearchaeota archaeon]